MYINGKWVKSSSGETFKSTNPVNEQTLAVFQNGNSKDVDKAVKAARKALPIWSSYPAPKRGEFLLEVAKLLRKDKERLSKILVQEMGKVLPEARGDVQEAIDMTELMAGEGRRFYGHTTPSELRDKFAMTVRKQIGVCGLITPWNFPYAIPAWKIMPALIAGNTIVFKPSSDTPLCAVELVKILIKAGLPPGVVNLVTGSGRAVGTPIVKHKDVDMISFTGSRATGEFITQNAGLKKVGLELGGKNPIIVMDDADLPLAVEGIIWGAFGTTGQRCTAASRVIVHKKVSDKLTKMLVSRANKLKLGNGLHSSTDVGPLINKAAVEKTHKYTQIGKKEGAKLMCGGVKGKGKGNFYRPTIFAKVKPSMRIAQEEIFGPSLAIIEVKNLNEAIKVANNVQYGLSSSIYTKDINTAFKAIE
ncbi:MAG: aldehyde dehydrogenase family protein, partial [Candidatus Diapherotrites archaeon]|nr:aldehyde dehydrogenase family protein [Candidatus Diapherotrites archaeon]